MRKKRITVFLFFVSLLVTAPAFGDEKRNLLKKVSSSWMLRDRRRNFKSGLNVDEVKAKMG